MRGLIGASWKGNIRELENALERAVILSETSILTPDDFPPGMLAEPTDDADSGVGPDDLRGVKTFGT